MKLREYLSFKLKKSFLGVSLIAFIILFLIEFVWIAQSIQSKVNKSKAFIQEAALNTELTNEWNYLPNKLDKFYDLLEKDNLFSYFGFDLYKNGDLIYRSSLKNDQLYKLYSRPLNIPNDKATLDFRIDLTKLVLLTLITSILLLALIYFLFKYISNQMAVIVSHALSPLEKIVDHFSDHSSNIKLESANIDELEILKIKMFDYKENRDRNEKLIIENEKQKIYLNLAKQVSHDISSPLEVIKNLTSEINFKEIQAKIVYQSALFRIEAILEDLGAKSDSKDIMLSLPEMLKLVYQEKKLQFQDINLKLNIEDHPLLNIHFPSKELMRVFSNIVNNAVQSMKDSNIEKNSKLITIQLDKAMEGIRIIIKDNGAGFPQSILDYNFAVPKTVGKNDGQGLGLFHAHQTLKSLKGKLNLRNDNGALVELIIPIDLPKEIFVIDDDRLTHLNWKIKAQSLGIIYRGFHCFDELKMALENLQPPKDIPIYSDWNFEASNAMKDLIVLNELGFTNIHLISGDTVELVSELSFIKSSQSKTFPWG